MKPIYLVAFLVMNGATLFACDTENTFERVASVADRISSARISVAESGLFAKESALTHSLADEFFQPQVAPKHTEPKTITPQVSEDLASFQRLGIVEKTAFDRELSQEMPSLSVVRDHCPHWVSYQVEKWLQRLRLLNPTFEKMAAVRLVTLKQNDPMWKRLEYFLGQPSNSGRDIGLVQLLRNDRKSEAIQVVNNSEEIVVKDPSTGKTIGSVPEGIKALTRPLELQEKQFLESLASHSPNVDFSVNRALSALRFIELYSKADHFRLLKAFETGPEKHVRWQRFLTAIKGPAFNPRNPKQLSDLTEVCTQPYYWGGSVSNLEHFSRPVTDTEARVLNRFVPEGSAASRHVDHLYWWLRRVEDLSPTTYEKALVALEALPANHQLIQTSRADLGDHLSPKMNPTDDLEFATQLIATSQKHRP